MKLLNAFLLIVLTLSVGSCELFDHGFDKGKKQKTKDFRAEFMTSLTLPVDDARDCGDLVYNNQEGEGISLGMGSFTTRVNFCVDLETFQYFDGEGSFLFNNGDEIYYTVSGQILPSDNPDYDLMFMDPFVITGGSGRFEGVSGGGMTSSFVTLFPEGGDQTDHLWEGKIIYPK